MRKDASGTAVAYERPSSFVSLLSGWVQQGLESFFATQRILVDLAMRQNTSAMKTIRQGLSETEEETKDGPMKILAEVAVDGTANFIEAQRILLDLTQKENEIVMNGVKERVSDYGTAVAMTNVIRRSIDTFVEMQQNFLTLASKQAQGWLGGEKHEEGEDNSLIGFASDAMAELVAAQNKFLDVIAEETNGPTDNEHVRKSSRADLAKLGRDAADTFIEAQKSLLDLARQQMHVNIKATSRAMDLKMPIHLLPMADMAGESVKSFVDAEKALVDSMTKGRAQNRKEAAAKGRASTRRAAAKRATRQAKSATPRKRAARVKAVEV